MSSSLNPLERPRVPIFLSSTGLAAALPGRAEERPDRIVTLEFAATLEADQADGERTITGRLLPYEEDLERPDFWTGATKQRWAKGSGKVRDNATLFYGHDHLNRGLPIGRITAHEHKDDGLYVTAKISKTPKGDEVYTLLQDGVLNRFSAGMYHVKNHLEDVDSDAPTLVHDEADVFEGSVVPDPAYQSATVDSVLDATTGNRRQHNPNPERINMFTEEQRARLAALRAMETLSATEAGEMARLVTLEAQADNSEPVTRGDLVTLGADVDRIMRQVATLGQGPDQADPNAVPAEFLAFASYGEFLQAAARGTDEAMALLAYVGGVVGDLGGWVKDSWVGDLYKPLQARRRVLQAFEQRPLPAEGMGVEFGRLLSDTTQVGVQAAEGDLLAYGKVAFETDRAGLVTYGGWGDMSRQEVERSSMAIVDKFFSSLLRRYAQTTEAAAQAMAVSTANGVALTGGVLDLTTVEGWTRFIVRAAKRLDDNGLTAEFALCSWDVFEDLAVLRLGTDGPFLLDRNTGRMDVKGLSGEVYNVEVIPVTAAADTVRVCDPSGIASFEASGAPFRLQDDDITHLTKAFSVYGYMALADEDHNAIVRPQSV